MTFKEKIYAVVASIPEGEVATYSQVAAAAGHPGAARAAGNAIHTNRDPVSVPCHRVVSMDGTLASNYGMGGPSAQRRRLEMEGVCFTASGKVMMERHNCDLTSLQYTPEKTNFATNEEW